MIVYLDTSSLVKLYAEKHALRGFDSIHLDSALTLRQEVSSSIVFSCFDDNLRKASEREALDQD